jgi:hypothetical protein
MKNFTITEEPISETEKKLVGLSVEVALEKKHLFAQLFLYVLLVTLVFTLGYGIDNIPKDGLLEALYYWTAFFIGLLFLLWLFVFKLSPFIHKKFILNSRLENKKDVRRFLLKGRVLSKRCDPGDVADSYYISLDTDYELQVNQSFFNVCEAGKAVEIKLIVMDYNAEQVFPALGVIVEEVVALAEG